jgi:glycogen operon protein
VRWDETDEHLLEFVRTLSALRRDHPVFRRRRFFQGHSRDIDGPGDISWLTPAGERMTDADWNAGYAKSLGVFLNGEAITEPDPRGRRVSDDSFLLLFNAHADPVGFTLPGIEFGERWEYTLDTDDPVRARDRQAAKARDRVDVAGHSLIVLRRLK